MFRHSESFGSFGSGQSTRRGWDIDFTTSLGDGPNGQNTWATGSANKVFDNQPTWVLGQRLKATNAGLYGVWQLQDSGTIQLELKRTVNLGFELYRGSTLIASSANNLYKVNEWGYLEMKATIANAGGTCVVKYKGDVVISFTGDTQQTANAYANRVYVYVGVGVNRICDLYILDGQAGLNDFLGDVRVIAKYIDANGSNQQWTPNVGTDHFAVVDEFPPNDDTDYLYTDVPGNKDTNGCQNLSGVAAIKAVTVLALARKDDAGAHQIATLTRIGATDYEGTTQPVGDTYAYYEQRYENSPATANPWTISEFNNTEFGAKMVS